MNYKIQLIALLFVLISCHKDDVKTSIQDIDNLRFISAVDISRYPEIADFNLPFYDYKGNKKSFINMLKENGINTIRLRLWVDPVNEHSGFNEVKRFSQDLKSKGFRTWITLHYSDTWADPAHQETPLRWEGISFAALKDSVYNYTKKIVSELEPNYIQIGNEINSGLLHPYGKISSNLQQFNELMSAGITAVRTNAKDTKIVIHYAGIEGSDWFFDQVSTLDYDIMGISYYPIWHGKSLQNLKVRLQYLSEMHNKEIVIAETAYPFTLKWNDWTNNIVGLKEQLILPEFPATSEGQRKFIENIRLLIQEVDGGIGFCYWGGELIAWKGRQSIDASPWENQALFDFENRALPVLREFSMD